MISFLLLLLLFFFKLLCCDCFNNSFYVPSGGYNIKTGPGCSIELMKFDMGGAAAVLGAAKALGQIKPAGVEVSPLSSFKKKQVFTRSECIQLFSFLQTNYHAAGAFHCCSL